MFVHQIHLPHHKHSAENETIELPLPGKVTISMAQHLGAPCTPAVSIGEKVKIGDVIEIAFGGRTLNVRVTDIKDSTKKADAGTMYEVIEG